MSTFFKSISIIFQPLFVTTYGLLWLINLDTFYYLPFQWRLLAIVGTFVFTCVVPLLPVYVLMRQGEVDDLFIHKKEQRTMPYIFSILAYSFWTFFLLKTLQLPIEIAIMGVGSIVSLIVLLFVNIKWKISAHLCSMGALFGFVAGVSYVIAINPIRLFVVLLIISALVALSRIELKAHTPLQTLVGFVVGFVCVFGSCFLTVSFL